MVPDKNHLDQTYIGLSKIWIKNHGTKIIWAKIAWEQIICGLKGCRMGRSDKVSLWCVALLINTRFRFFLLE